MAGNKRIKTSYPGVFYRESQRIGGKGIERVYYIVFKKDGKVYEEKAGRQYADDMTPSRAAAIRAERIENKRRSRKEIREQEKVEREKVIWTISKLWQGYKNNRTNLKGIVQDENRFKNYLAPYFSEKEPSELCPFDIDRLRLKILKDKKPATARNVLELLRRIINFGIRKRLCVGLDFKIEMPKVNNLKTEDLTPDELSRLLKAIDEDSNIMAANMMKMALYCGLRRGEMFNLEWKDVDFERGFIRILDPKGGINQTIPINNATRKLLQEHIKTDSPYVFPGRNGLKRSDISKAIHRIKERAGLPKDFRALHGLRHVFASMLASSGQVDMYTLQRLLTHKSPLMTQRYAHLRDEALRKASNLAGDIIEQTIKQGEKIIYIEKKYT